MTVSLLGKKLGGAVREKGGFGGALKTSFGIRKKFEINKNC